MIDIADIHKVLLVLDEHGPLSTGEVGELLAATHLASTTKRQWALTRLGHAALGGYAKLLCGRPAVYDLTPLGADLCKALHRHGERG